MKKIYASLTLLLLAVVGFSQTQVYLGNGFAGFGGPVGNGSLTINYDGTFLNFTLNGASSLGSNGLVIYIDNGTGGGFTTTSQFFDVTSSDTKAISGYTDVDNSGDSGRATLNFLNGGFAPQYALAFGGFTPGAELVKLATGSVLISLATPTVAISGNTYSVSITPSNLGLTAPFSFNFQGTLVSGTGYRASEAIGINFPQGQGNFGWTGNGAGICNDTSAALVFTSGSLAVNLGNFTGVAKGNIVTLNWNTKSEINLSQFNIQKSVDGVKWNTIGNVSAKNAITGSQYSFVDNNATASKNYYRLQSLNKDASFTYSSVLIVSKTGGHNVTILGNPAKGVINLNISDDNATNYTMSLYSADGKLLTTQAFNGIAGTNKASVNLPSSAKGMCLLKVSSGTSTETFRVLVQ